MGRGVLHHHAIMGRGARLPKIIIIRYHQWKHLSFYVMCFDHRIVSSYYTRKSALSAMSTHFSPDIIKPIIIISYTTHWNNSSLPTTQEYQLSIWYSATEQLPRKLSQ